MREIHNLDRTGLAKDNCTDHEEITPECNVSYHWHCSIIGDPPLRCAPNRFCSDGVICPIEVNESTAPLEAGDCRLVAAADFSLDLRLRPPRVIS